MKQSNVRRKSNLLAKLTFGSFLLFGLIWLALFIVVFDSYLIDLFFKQSFSENFTRGEIGDFLNGLSGFAFFIVIGTAYFQFEELKAQRQQSFEAGIFRTFEVLKPELENLSVRIVAKTLITDIKNDGHFEVMYEKFQFDKTVFLRALSKDDILNAILGKLKTKGSGDLSEALYRFRSIMFFFDEYTDDAGVQPSFQKAIRSTEVFKAHKRLGEMIYEELEEGKNDYQ